MSRSSIEAAMIVSPLGFFALRASSASFTSFMSVVTGIRAIQRRDLRQRLTGVLGMRAVVGERDSVGRRDLIERELRRLAVVEVSVGKQDGQTGLPVAIRIDVRGDVDATRARAIEAAGSSCPP
jgi:hypothetical protein